jgi:predicted nucleic acid-binding protein
MSDNARIVVDTGPLVAAVNANDEHYIWAREAFGRLRPPLFTCEAVLSEVQFLLQVCGGNPAAVLAWVREGVLKIAFSAGEEVERLIELQRSYRNVPMSFADACLVRMAEIHERSTVMTTDSDFRIFRRHRRQLIPLLAPLGI